MPTAIRAEKLGLRFWLQHQRSPTVHSGIVRFLKGKQKPEEFWALRDVTFEVPTGQVLGIIGANGSGKSTLLRVLARIYAPDEGSVEIRGRVASLITLGAGFKGDLTGIENIRYNGLLLGLTRQQIEERLDEIVEYAELGDRIDTPVRTYSSGMRARLGFSVAIHVDPDILIIDEFLGVGDARFRAKTQEKFKEFFSRGITIVMVQHNMGAIVELCHSAMLLDKGRVGATGKPLEVVNEYMRRQGLPAFTPPQKPGTAFEAGYEPVEASS